MWGWPGTSDIKAGIKTSFLIHAVKRGLPKPGSGAFSYHWYTKVEVLQSFCLLASVLPISTQSWTKCQNEDHSRVWSRMLTWDTCAHPGLLQRHSHHRHTHTLSFTCFKTPHERHKHLLQTPQSKRRSRNHYCSTGALGGLTVGHKIIIQRTSECP